MTAATLTSGERAIYAAEFVRALGGKSWKNEPAVEDALAAAANAVYALRAGDSHRRPEAQWQMYLSFCAAETPSQPLAPTKNDLPPDVVEAIRGLSQALADLWAGIERELRSPGTLTAESIAEFEKAVNSYGDGLIDALTPLIDWPDRVLKATGYNGRMDGGRPPTEADVRRVIKTLQESNGLLQSEQIEERRARDRAVDRRHSDLTDVVESLRARAPADWSRDSNSSWIYGVLVGFDEATLEKVAKCWGWSAEDVSKLRRYCSLAEGFRR